MAAIIISLILATSEAKLEVQIKARELSRHPELGLNYANFKQHNNSYLAVDRVGVVMVHKHWKCGVACANHASCFSFNIAIRPDIHGHFLCELLSTDKYNSSNNFTSSADFNHFSVVTTCLRNPCKNGGSCIPKYDDDTFHCICSQGYRGTICELSGDCAAILKSGVTTSGIYLIDPDGKGSMNVYCDMVTDGGGWTVIQRRKDGSVNFYLDWASYKQGFGKLTSEFWLGNDNIHRLSASGNTTLRVDLEDWDDRTAYAVYGRFVVDDETNKYRLTVGSFSGTAGDSLTGKHNGMFFSTGDSDNDQTSDYHCAQFRVGAWWYNACYASSLNGMYLGNVVNSSGLVWYHWKLKDLSLKGSEMKVRRSSFTI